MSVSNPKGNSRKKPSPTGGSGFNVNILKYLRDVRAEGRRVTWPSRRTTLVTTGAVLVMVTITCIFFFIVDQVIGLGVRALFGIGG